MTNYVAHYASSPIQHNLGIHIAYVGIYGSEYQQAFITVVCGLRAVRQGYDWFTLIHAGIHDMQSFCVVEHGHRHLD